MKHVKSYEKRSYKEYKKYYRLLMDKFGSNNVIMFYGKEKYQTEEEKIHLFVEYSLGISTDRHVLENMVSKMRPYDYTVRVNPNQVVLRFVINVTDELMEQFDMELESQTYNI